MAATTMTMRYGVNDSLAKPTGVVALVLKRAFNCIYERVILSVLKRSVLKIHSFVKICVLMHW